jgi:hypothetical protein
MYQANELPQFSASSVTKRPIHFGGTIGTYVSSDADWLVR